jgi:hypothetical protein
MSMKVRLISVLLLIVAAAAHGATNTATHAFETATEARGVLRVILELPAGEVKIVNGPANRISIRGTATKEYRKEKEAARAQRVADATSMNVAIHGSRAVLTPQFDRRIERGRRDRDTVMKLEIAVPKNVHLEVRQKVGELDVDGDFGDITVGMRVGEVTIRVPKRSVRELNARTRIGEVRTNMGDRVVTREGFFPLGTEFFNEGGHALLKVALGIGEIRIDLR